jgi:hypothetical protein
MSLYYSTCKVFSSHPDCQPKSLDSSTICQLPTPELSIQFSAATANYFIAISSQSSLTAISVLSLRAEQSIAEAYCRQPAGTLSPGTGPRWDPWPYICSISRPLLCFVFPFVDPPYWRRRGWSAAWDTRYIASGRPPQKTPFPNNSSIVIKVCLLRCCTETVVLLLLRPCSFPREPIYLVVA